MQWNTPALEHLDLSYNNISSIDAGLHYNHLKYLNLESNNVQGQLKQWNTPELEYLDLTFNSLSGVSNLSYPNLYFLTYTITISLENSLVGISQV